MTCSYIAITISFDRFKYFLNENNGSVELKAVLSNPSATEITVQIIINDGTAISKYAHTHTHLHTCTHPHTHPPGHAHIYTHTLCINFNYKGYFLKKFVGLQAYHQIHVCTA